MEANGCSQRWRMNPSEMSKTDSERHKRQREQDRGGPHKSVSLAPTSRYRTDTQYAMRKPLFSAENTSILKKTHPLKEKHLGVSRGEHCDLNFLTRPREDLTRQSFSLFHPDMSPPLASSESLSSPTAVSELRGRLYPGDASSGSPFSANGSAWRSVSNSIPEAQTLNPFVNRQLTSTVQNPTYSPLPKPGQRDGKGVWGGKPCSPGGHTKGDPMSSYQADYWACAIPKALPPSPDRYCTDWNPNREYQALLDYIYPLRPRQAVSEWDSPEPQRHFLLQDSGIELDHLCSTSLSGLGYSVNSASQTGERSPLGASHRSPELLGFSRSPNGLPPGTPLSLTDPVGLSLNSLGCSKDRGGLAHYKTDHDHQHCALSSSTSSSVLPLPRCVCGDVDEEFRPLPEQLEELRLLSTQVREVTVQLSRPAAATLESLELGTASITMPEKQEAEDVEKEGDTQDTEEGREERNTARMGDTGAVRKTSGTWVEPVGGGLSQSRLREVEALVEQLCGLILPGSQRSDQEDLQQSDSLMQHIQVFCSHLEQLIQQLYAVSEKMEQLAAPTLDIDGVKSSLAVYQREVSNHQPLTSCVLHTGQLLLSCINNTSSLLKDTLLLIESQRGAVPTFTEYLFSSILSAMDSLTRPSQPSPV